MMNREIKLSAMTDEMVSGLIDLARRNAAHIEFPLTVSDESGEVEIDQCSRCGVIDQRNGDWFDDICPSCADATHGDGARTSPEPGSTPSDSTKSFYAGPGAREETPHQNLSGTATSVNYIQIDTWRESGDDDDTLTVGVFGAGDDTNQLDLIAGKHNLYFGDGPDRPTDDENAPSQGFSICEETIRDGDLLTSHDGRQFRVRIEEVTDEPKEIGA